MTAAQDAPERLTRTLTLGPLVLFGLAYMAPMIVLGTFGVLDDASHGTVPTAYLLALVAMLFTAVSYGRMARAFPVAGSAYTYTRRSIDSRVGFLVGWAVLLDYFWLPTVIWLIGASYLTAEFPGVPKWTWIVAFIALTTILNIIGLKLATNINLLLMAMQVLVLVFFIVLSFGHAASSGSILSLTPFGHAGTTFSGIAAAAAIAAYSFLGFDAITTLTEETRDPERTVPRAIVLVTIIGGVIFVVASYATQLVASTIQIKDPNSAAFEIAGVIGGRLFSAVFLAGLVITQFASGVAAQASASRLLYAMGRDSVLPKKLFGFISDRFHTPLINIVLTGAVGLIGILLDISTAASFINFGAFTAFTFVNLCVIAYALRKRTLRGPAGWILNFVVPLIGAAIDIWLLTNLDQNALLIGLGWLIVGIVILIYLTRGFRRPPPEVTFSE